MKKLLSAIGFLGLILTLTIGLFIYQRFQQNMEQVFPFPYHFNFSAEALKPDAPILIVGDQMAAYMARFEAELAATISVNLEKPIRVQSLSTKGHGLHRTLHTLKALVQWPQIVIYQGGSQEFAEAKFKTSEIPVIKKNVQLYQDDRIETLLILKPWLSRIVYEPHEKISLGETPSLKTEIPETEFMQRLEMSLILFEQELIQLIQMSRDRNSLLILTTTPVNLDVPPKRVCEFTSNLEIEKELMAMKELVASNNFKSAYTRSSKAIKLYQGNALLFFQHGNIAKKLGKMDEAQEAFLKASAYDCQPWRATELQNAIIRRVADKNKVMLFDFARFVQKDWDQSVTFFDDLFAQNLYYEKAMVQMGLLIKQILKL